MDKSRVTLYLPTDIWRAFRVACLEQDTSASQAVTTLIEAWLRPYKGQLGAGAGSDYPPLPRTPLHNDTPEMIDTLNMFLRKE